MLSGRGSTPSRKAMNVFRPEFQLKRINAKFLHPCEPHFGHKKDHTDHSSKGNPDRKTSESNMTPIVRNPIDHLTAIAGSLYRFQVPEVSTNYVFYN